MVEAVGDTNGDDIDDLAIGIPGEDIGGIVDCGAIAVVYGTPFGLIVAAPPFIVQAAAPFPDAMEPGDEFGNGEMLCCSSEVFFGSAFSADTTSTQSSACRW